MVIGERLKFLREQRKLSRGEIEKRTGLLRCYICRVENGYTVPAVETLTKFANALEVPMYRLFYEGKSRPKPPKSVARRDLLWGAAPGEIPQLRRFRRDLGMMGTKERELLLFMAEQLAEGKDSGGFIGRRGRPKRDQ